MKKQKNRSIKIACLIFAFLLFANMTLFSAGIASPEVSFEIDKNLMDVFEGKVTGIQKEDQPLALDRVIGVQDFSGEEYYVVECAPAGYLIYHPASGIFVETSPSAPSPYRGLSGEHLYYGGPTEYYIEIDGTYYHTVIDEVIETSAKVERMQQACGRDDRAARAEQKRRDARLRSERQQDRAGDPFPNKRIGSAERSYAGTGRLVQKPQSVRLSGRRCLRVYRTQYDLCLFR